MLLVRMYWTFRTSTPSQSEIFCLTAVIVACSLCSYTVAFQDQHTLPKRNILSHSCYCGLFRMEFPFRTSTPSQREIFSLTAVIVACSLCFLNRTAAPCPKRNIISHTVIVLGMEFPFRTRTPSQREIFSLTAVILACVWSWKFHCISERASHNNSCEREYFSLGGCAGPERPTPYEQATITAVRENISLWEGVLVLEGHCI